MKAIYFSPTFSTRKIVREIAKGFIEQPEELDITSRLTKSYLLKPSEITILGVPVYMGRVPKQAIENLQKITGDNTPVITVVVYGNRAYDDALIELNETCKQQGFNVIGSGAFVAEHCMNSSIATGRPNEKDLKIAQDFGRQALDKLNSGKTLENVVVKGNIPYKKAANLPVYPKKNKNCADCGLCAENCPVSAISNENSNMTNKELCISCMRCIKECPSNARELQLNLFTGLLINKLLKRMCKKYKEPEIVV
jgi:ferredoxin